MNLMSFGALVFPCKAALRAIGQRGLDNPEHVMVGDNITRVNGIVPVYTTAIICASGCNSLRIQYRCSWLGITLNKQSLKTRYLNCEMTNTDRGNREHPLLKKKKNEIAGFDPAISSRAESDSLRPTKCAYRSPSGAHSPNTMQ